MYLLIVLVCSLFIVIVVLYLFIGTCDVRVYCTCLLYFVCPLFVGTCLSFVLLFFFVVGWYFVSWYVVGTSFMCLLFFIGTLIRFVVDCFLVRLA